MKVYLQWVFPYALWGLFQPLHGIWYCLHGDMPTHVGHILPGLGLPYLCPHFSDGHEG